MPFCYQHGHASTPSSAMSAKRRPAFTRKGKETQAVSEATRISPSSWMICTRPSIGNTGCQKSSLLLTIRLADPASKRNPCKTSRYLIPFLTAATRVRTTLDATKAMMKYVAVFGRKSRQLVSTRHVHMLTKSPPCRSPSMSHFHGRKQESVSATFPWHLSYRAFGAQTQTS